MQLQRQSKEVVHRSFRASNSATVWQLQRGWEILILEAFALAGAPDVATHELFRSTDSIETSSAEQFLSITDYRTASEMPSFEALALA